MILYFRLLNIAIISAYYFYLNMLTDLRTLWPTLFSILDLNYLIILLNLWLLFRTSIFYWWLLLLAIRLFITIFYSLISMLLALLSLQLPNTISVYITIFPYFASILCPHHMILPIIILSIFFLNLFSRHWVCLYLIRSYWFTLFSYWFFISHIFIIIFVLMSIAVYRFGLFYLVILSKIFHFLLFLLF